MKLLSKVKAVPSWFFHLSLPKKIGVLVIVIGIGWFGYTKVFVSSQNIPQYQSAQVEKGSIISSLTESGNISGNQTNVSSPTDGVIQEVYVKNGDLVEAGDNLFKVTSTATPEEKASAYASYLSAQNTLKAAQSKLNGLQAALFKANQTFVNDKGNTADPITDDPMYVQEKADWLQAEADYKNQAGVIAQAQANFNSASFAYQATQDSIVTAPIAGTVANFSAVEGTNVTASSGNSTSSSTSTSSTTTSSTPVLVLGDFSKLQVKVAASEVDIPKIHANQKATITLDAFPDKTFVGTVQSKDIIGANSSGVVTYTVYITFVSTTPDMQPGMTASVTIQTDRRDDVLSVPTSAIQTANGESTVRIVKNGNISPVVVTTGITSDTDTEITSGLAEGDTIVTSALTTTGTGGTGQTTSPFSSFGGSNRGFSSGGGRTGGR